MKVQNKVTPFEQLEEVLAETAQAIRSGDFASMAKLAAQMEAALVNLPPTTDQVRISALRDLAQRNVTALEAAGRGVRAARRRLSEIVAVRAGGKTYDQEGKTQKIGAPDSALKARL